MKSLFRISFIFICSVPGLHGQAIHHLPGSTQKIEQLVGDYDRHLGLATRNLTNTRYQIWGTDLGVPFTHKGKTYLLFGDTPSDVGDGVDRDPIAFTSDLDPENGISLEFYTTADGAFAPIHIPGISQGAFEVPLDGISINDVMYVYHSTDQMTRSVLAKSMDDGRTFALINEKVSDQFFINVSVNKIERFAFTGLPGDAENGLLVMGSGTYRQSSIYLYYQPEHEIEDRQAIRYFSGIIDGLPNWSTSEAESVPIIEEDCVGELSSYFSSDLNLWLVMYNCDQPRGIVVRTAKVPWGPYSPPVVIFDPDRDMGYCHFIHANWDSRKCDEVHDPGRENEWGGEYGPYIFKDLSVFSDTLLTIYYTMSTWNPYTTVLMKSSLVVPDQTNNILQSDLISEINPQPNLTHGPFHLNLSDVGDYSVRLVNVDGKIVYHQDGNEQLDVSPLPPGLYIGRVSINDIPKYLFKVIKID